MLAAYTTSKKTVEFRNLPEPIPAANEALVRIRHITLCGTDLHIFENNYATELPIIQGHEFVGTIEHFGRGTKVAGLQVGDAVAVSPMLYCGTCYACSIGRMNACRSISVYGCYQDGALAELMTLPLSKLYRVPTDLPIELAPLAEPMSIAMQAVNRGRAVAGETAVVLGAGPIGLLTTLSLVEAGVTVLTADVRAERAEFARRFGATEGVTLDPDSGIPTHEQAALIDRVSAGAGASLVIEATGAPEALQSAVNTVSNAGRVVAVGISDRVAALPMRSIPAKEIDLIGSRNSTNLIGESLALLARHRDEASALITHRFPFDQLPHGFDTMRSSEEMVAKVAIDMPEAAV